MILKIIDCVNAVFLTVAAACLADGLFAAVGYEFSDWVFEHVCRTRVFLRWTGYVLMAEIIAARAYLWYFAPQAGILIGRWAEAKRRTKILFWTTFLAEILAFCLAVLYMPFHLPYSARY
ncbi:MAG: hypothetical protein II561_06860 [Thermoguttaceae bacterium]|nr:hypothetical protein [Thermoguttaceae bacterium]MBQ3822034.1 hypothetical protein [Thermoguttaceae bacterium]MBQ4195542.1 hypothetical protein [Thermoguttaceae bacterium]